MELTAEMLEARRLELEQQKSSVLADLHAIDGALQQLSWSLEQLEKDEDLVGPVVEGSRGFDFSGMEKEVGPEEPASDSS